MRSRLLKTTILVAAAGAMRTHMPLGDFAVEYRALDQANCESDNAQAIGAISHRLCRLIWKILHEPVRYEERGPAVSDEAKKVRARKIVRELRSLGHHVERLQLHRAARHDREIFDPGY